MKNLIVVGLILLSVQLWAAQIKSVNGKKVTIDLENESYKIGDVLNILDQNDKVVGITKIVKIDGNRANGLLKGKATPGFTTALRKNKSKQKKSAKYSQSDFSKKMFIGGLFGYNNVSIDSKLTSGATVSLSGNGMSLKGLFDIALFPSLPMLSLRGLAGVEQLQADGASNAECGGTCEIKITYLTVDAWARYLIKMGNFTPWGGIGFDVMLPLSKTSSVINKSSITTTYLFSIGGGLDWTLTNTSYLPFQIEYNFYPSTDSVKTNSFTLRGGYATTF